MILPPLLYPLYPLYPPLPPFPRYCPPLPLAVDKSDVHRGVADGPHLTLTYSDRLPTSDKDMGEIRTAA